MHLKSQTLLRCIFSYQTRKSARNIRFSSSEKEGARFLTELIHKQFNITFYQIRCVHFNTELLGHFLFSYLFVACFLRSMLLLTASSRSKLSILKRMGLTSFSVRNPSSKEKLTELLASKYLICPCSLA